MEVRSAIVLPGQTSRCLQNSNWRVWGGSISLPFSISVSQFPYLCPFNLQSQNDQSNFLALSHSEQESCGSLCLAKASLCPHRLSKISSCLKLLDLIMLGKSLCHFRNRFRVSMFSLWLSLGLCSASSTDLHQRTSVWNLKGLINV